MENKRKVKLRGHWRTEALISLFVWWFVFLGGGGGHRVGISKRPIALQRGIGSQGWFCCAATVAELLLKSH